MADIPEMTRSQEGEFWETHDATDYLAEMMAVEVTVGPRPQNKCYECKKVMLSRNVDLNLASGQVQLRQLRQLYCPEGHETRLAEELTKLPAKTNKNPFHSKFVVVFLLLSIVNLASCDSQPYPNILAFISTKSCRYFIHYQLNENPIGQKK